MLPSAERRTGRPFIPERFPQNAVRVRSVGEKRRSFDTRPDMLINDACSRRTPKGPRWVPFGRSSFSKKEDAVFCLRPRLPASAGGLLIHKTGLRRENGLRARRAASGNALRGPDPRGQWPGSRRGIWIRSAQIDSPAICSLERFLLSRRWRNRRQCPQGCPAGKRSNRRESPRPGMRACSRRHVGPASQAGDTDPAGNSVSLAGRDSITKTPVYSDPGVYGRFAALQIYIDIQPEFRRASAQEEVLSTSRIRPVSDLCGRTDEISDFCAGPANPFAPSEAGQAVRSRTGSRHRCGSAGFPGGHSRFRSRIHGAHAVSRRSSHRKSRLRYTQIRPASFPAVPPAGEPGTARRTAPARRSWRRWR